MSRNQRIQRNRRDLRNWIVAAGLLSLMLIGAVSLFAFRDTANAAQQIYPADYQTQFAQANTAHLLLDVRTPDEFASGHIHGAVNISVDSLETRLSEVPRTQPVVVYCHSGNRSAAAAQILIRSGYTTIYDLGGINNWEAQGFPVE